MTHARHRRARRRPPERPVVARACNRCNAPAAGTGCPRCGCPEYRLVRDPQRRLFDQ
jgi:hypothetical protein